MAASRNRPAADLATRAGAFFATRLAADEPVCVGLSGGCDSIVLLHLAWRAGLAGRLRAVHVHHGLSANADAWAAFCAESCGQRQIPLEIIRVEIPRGSGEGLEAAARRARYRAFAAAGVSTLLLAHHLGDQAETLLFNLMRGAGVAGAAAMRDERRLHGMRVLRPLLASRREAIEDYARAEGLRWINDESNDDRRFSRNFLRHEVLPVLERRFPAAQEALATTAGHLAEADALLGEIAAVDWQNLVKNPAAGEIPVKMLRTLTAPRLKNLLRYRLRAAGWTLPDAARLDEFVRQLLTAGPDRHPELRLPGGILHVAGGCLRGLP